jgi:hypothetical protein
VTTPPDPDEIEPFYLKRHDTKPPIQKVLWVERQSGQWVKVTDVVTVKFIMRAAGAADPVVDTAATWDAASSTATYSWIADDTAESGSFQGEFEYLDADGKKRTIPNPGYIPIIISDDLDDA